MTDLLPCPFCGSSTLRYDFCGSQGYIQCDECDAPGPCDERAADPICDGEAACNAWNRRAALTQPEPQGPTDEELDELWAEIDGGGAIWAWQDFARAVLTRWGRPAIEPVPVAERLPGPGDCDAEGCCWFYSGRYGRWERLLHKLSLGYTHWLPHHALPVPQQGE